MHYINKYTNSSLLIRSRNEMIAMLTNERVRERGEKGGGGEGGRDGRTDGRRVGVFMREREREACRLPWSL
jgi:hypothetical protein